MSKNLDIKIFRTKDLGRRDSVSRDRHCLDHDRAASMVGARLDVTERCGLFPATDGENRASDVCGSHPSAKDAEEWGTLIEVLSASFNPMQL
jgi:hypothetical protein